MESSTESFVLVQQPTSARSASAFPWPDPAVLSRFVEQSRSTRPSQPDGLLAIDHLLALAGAPPLQPDRDQAGPQGAGGGDHVDRVVAQLELLAHPDQPSPLVAKSCLYYLALALALDDQDRHVESAHRYAEDHLLLPLAFRLAVRALRALDAGHYSDAVGLLVHPAVTPDFVPRTFAVLATLPDPPATRARLVVDYWTLARLDLAQYSVREARYVVEALCAPERKRGVAQAWNLARDWPREHERPQLWTAILETCFGGNYTGLASAHHLSALLPFPFTPTEDSLVTAFCLTPPSSLLGTGSGAGNTVLPVDWRLSKLVAESRPVDALEFLARARHAFAQRGNGSADSLAEGANDARDRLLKAVEANLTTVERTRLQLELASISSGAQAAAPTGKPPTGDGSSSTSTLATLTRPAWAPTPAATGDMDCDGHGGAPTDSVVSDMYETTLPAAAAAAAAPAGEAHRVAAAPPRTLAELRQQRLPPAPAPKPTAADLPLSASPFVRRRPATATKTAATYSQVGSGGGDGGGSDVLRALQQQQQTPKKGAGGQSAGTATPAFAGPLGVTTTATAAGVRGSPFRLGSLHMGSGTSTALGKGGAASDAGSHAGSGLMRLSPPAGTPAGAAAKPTLAGFGSVRKPVAAASIAAAQQVADASTPMKKKLQTRHEPRQDGGRRLEQGEDDDEAGDGDGDAEMQGVDGDDRRDSNHQNGDERVGEDDAAEFARRAARNPAIQRTIQAAATSSAASSSSHERQDPVGTVPLAAKRGATPARKTTRRADKRRAVQGQPPHEDRVDPSRTEQVKLPPGAFPGGGGEEDTAEDSDGDAAANRDRDRDRDRGRAERPTRRGSAAGRGPASSARSSSSASNSKGGSKASGAAAPPPATPARSRRTTTTTTTTTTRSRASTAEPTSPPPPSRSRRTTRASSVQARDSSTEREAGEPEMRQVESTKGRASIPVSAPGKTPVRRSSRLRSGNGGAGAGGTGRAAGEQGKIDEASEEDA